jgi:hypothetical protein
MPRKGVLTAHSHAFDFAFAHVGRTLLSDAVDVDLDFDRDFDLALARVGRTLLSDAFDFDPDFDLDLALDSNREGHGLSRADKSHHKSIRLQPPRAPRRMKLRQTRLSHIQRLSS